MSRIKDFYEAEIEKNDANNIEFNPDPIPDSTQVGVYPEWLDEEIESLEKTIG
jgi:hypothetical protein